MKFQICIVLTLTAMCLAAEEDPKAVQKRGALGVAYPAITVINPYLIPRQPYASYPYAGLPVAAYPHLFYPDLAPVAAPFAPAELFASSGQSVPSVQFTPASHLTPAVTPEATLAPIAVY